MNIFGVLGLRDEKYHNRMLVWLLDPTGNHGLGSRFLAKFLRLVEIEHNPENFVQIKPEYAIYAPDNLKKRKPDIYLQTDGRHIFIEDKVRQTSINDPELQDQATYIRSQGYVPAIHIFIVPLLRDIPKSTQAIIKENDIRELQWSALTKILDEYIQTQETPDDIRVILEQYSAYLKEHVMQELKGPDIVEIMKQYVNYTLYKYQNVERKARELIENFLSIAGEEIQDKVAKITGQQDWEAQIGNFHSSYVNWGLYLTRPRYKNLAFFGIWLTYFPPTQDDQLLHMSISLKIDAQHVEVIRPRIKEFQAHQPGKHHWGESKIGENFYQFYEDIQLQWDQVENWQEAKNFLVERAVGWIEKFNPILEKQINE